jgi:hypothetical protein
MWWAFWDNPVFLKWLIGRRRHLSGELRKGALIQINGDRFDRNFIGP